MPNLNIPIRPPRVAFLNPQSGTISREWYLFFLSLFQAQGGSNISLDDLQKEPPSVTIDDVVSIIDNSVIEASLNYIGLNEQIVELQKQVHDLQLDPV